MQCIVRMLVIVHVTLYSCLRRDTLYKWVTQYNQHHLCLRVMNLQTLAETMFAFRLGVRRSVLSSAYQPHAFTPASFAGLLARPCSSKNCSGKADIGPQDFNNAAEAFKTKSTNELLRGWFVYNLLSFHTLVRNSESVSHTIKIIS